jgi:hypothetical protein
MSSETIRAVIFGANNRPYHRLEDVGPVIESFLAEAGIAADATSDRGIFTRSDLEDYDAIINYHPSPRTSEWTLAEDAFEGIRSFVRDGGGYLPLHAALAFPEGERAYADQASLAGGELIGHGEIDELAVEIEDGSHPITAGVDSFRIRDEPYGMRHDEDVDVLATVAHDSIGRSAVCWAKPEGRGRVCYYANGHDERSFRNENLQRIVTNAVRWVAGR